uniref:Uncharacterized protein n=1 Tax=Tetradesmus obliquus TaxID=3088 RepID=A0A383VR04_TETOB
MNKLCYALPPVTQLTRGSALLHQRQGDVVHLKDERHSLKALGIRQNSLLAWGCQLALSYMFSAVSGGTPAEVVAHLLNVAAAAGVSGGQQFNCLSLVGSS